MDEPRIPTQLQLRQCDRELLTRIKPLIGDSSMSAAASFVFDCAGEQIVAWLEEAIWLRLPTNGSQSTTNGSQSTTNESQSTTNESQSTTNGSQSTTNGSQSTPIKTNDAIDDLDALLGD